MCGTAAVAAGVVVIEIAFKSVVPLRIDWGWFQSNGMALLCLVSFILSYLEPRHPWRWGFLPILVNPAWMLIRSGDLGNLWPIFLFIFMAYAIPTIIAAYFGMLLHYWRTRRS
jgi:hypothetical protein